MDAKKQQCNLLEWFYLYATLQIYLKAGCTLLGCAKSGLNLLYQNNKTNPLASLHSMQAAEARTIVVGIRIYSIYEILE
jgi:hypothetical protein